MPQKKRTRFLVRFLHKIGTRHVEAKPKHRIVGKKVYKDCDSSLTLRMTDKQEIHG